MFYIVKEAIYFHGVYGPYKTVAAAKKAFLKAHSVVSQKEDRFFNPFDGHHDYYVVEGLSDFDGENPKYKIVEQIHYEALT